MESHLHGRTSSAANSRCCKVKDIDLVSQMRWWTISNMMRKRLRNPQLEQGIKLSRISEAVYVVGRRVPVSKNLIVSIVLKIKP